MSEPTTGSVVHGAGSGTLWIWAESDRVVCEVHDGGRLNDPLGRRPPRPTQPASRRLLLVHQLADLVRVRTGLDGTTPSLLPPRPAGAAADPVPDPDAGSPRPEPDSAAGLWLRRR
ncbi:hypothetical protein ACWDY4_09880 [Streptomyces olivaceoviridis]